MRGNDTKQKDYDIIAKQRTGDYMKSNLEIQEKLYMEISPDNASKTWRFPFLNQNGLRTKEAACRTE